MNTRSLPVLLAAAALMLSGCAATGPKAKKLPGADDPALAGTRPGADEAPALPSPADVAEMALRGKEFVAAPELQTARFDFDAYALSDEARASLRANADYLKQHPDLEVLVEGHCDERGTTEYNLALGQKRAKAVRDYYLRLGVRGAKVATLSFGEERPACAEATEDCWGRNRRAETKVRAQVSSAPAAPGPTQVR